MRTHLVIHAVHPAGPKVTFGLLGDASVTRSGGTGWTVVDRPHRGAAVQWLDYGPLQMSMSLMLDGLSDHPKHPRGVETDVGEVSGWERPVHGDQPAILRVSGPVPHTSLKWVLKSLTWGPALRHHHAGHRLQQSLDVVLLEYVPPKIITTSSPAKAAQERQSSSSTGTGSNRRYTVKAGDTLSSIAAAKLGAAKRWPEIARLNGLRDPDNLTVGQVLKLPPA